MIDPYETPEEREADRREVAHLRATVRTRVTLDCGAIGIFDWASRCGYICQTCLCVAGSVGSPCWRKPSQQG